MGTTRCYVHAEIVQAWPEARNGIAGYAFRSRHGDEWLAAAHFERRYLITGATLASQIHITDDVIDAFISRVEFTRFSHDATFGHAICRNGFVVSETVVCVHPNTYDQAIAEQICMGKIKRQVANYLRFLIRCAVDSLAPVSALTPGSTLPCVETDEESSNADHCQ